ncbi:MAG: sigma-54-dependent Fis family transcriptional regulator [Deltaproteobacteria bacterium]|nr:sigma-54-dependent Fis family transcriptional regulator [Deltaproteobacteria bacterium]
MYRILVVDDEEELRKQLINILSEKGYSVVEAADGLEACDKLSNTDFPLVLCDVKMPRMDGLEFLKHVRSSGYSTTVALLTAHGNVRDAIEAIREGAFDYIEKPINEEKLLQLVQKAERAFDMITKATLSAPILALADGSECVGQSRGMKRVFQLVERLTRVNTSVLIRGENGTGKELVARAIHYNCPRKNHPFVAVNCAAIPENLIESELFGHEKGAFTGADQRKIGKFQFAVNGTLFLDEIGDMSPATQVKLLRVLQDHSFTPVGSNREVKADVRIIAATNREIEKLIHEGKFREDLYYRLNVMPILLPPLRERRDDIPSLVHHFVDKFNREHGQTILGVNSETISALESFHWPGNIRELENAIEHAFVVETADEITFFSLPEYIRKAARKTVPTRILSASSSAAPLAWTEGMDWEKTKEAFEKEFIIQALKNNRGRINLTAEQANIPKNTLLRKIKKYNINPREFGALDSDLI